MIAQYNQKIKSGQHSQLSQCFVFGSTSSCDTGDLVVTRVAQLDASWKPHKLCHLAVTNCDTSCDLVGDTSQNLVVTRAA